MKSLFIYLSLLLLLPAASAQQSYSNQTEPHAQLSSYATPKTALAGIPDTRFFKPIDTGWKYKITPAGGTKDLSYLSADFNADGWSFFKTGEAIVGAKSEVVYFNTFYVSQSWDFREIFISADIPNTAYTLYINGQKVGHNYNTRQQAVFDITKYATEGTNRIAIVCDNRRIDLDMEQANNLKANQLSSVAVYSTPKVRLSDYKYIATTATDQTGNLQLDLEVRTHLLNPKEVLLKYELYDGSTLIAKEERWSKLGMKETDKVSFHTTIPGVKNWSPEQPFLYKAIVSVVSENRITECFKLDIGFTEYTTQGARWLVDGKETKVYGIDYTTVPVAEDPQTYIRRTTAELTALRNAGFNAVRLTTAPQPSVFYSLCDSLGLFVFDQANINTTKSGLSRSVGGSVANNPKHSALFAERALSQFFQTRNHPSVAHLNLSAQGANGYNLYETYLLLKNRDDSRLVSSTGTDYEWNNDIIYIKHNAPGAIVFDRPVFLVYDAADQLPAAVAKMKEENRFSGFFIADNRSIRLETAKQLLAAIEVVPQKGAPGVFEITLKNNKYPENSIKIDCSILSATGEKISSKTVKPAFQKGKYTLDTQLQTIEGKHKKTTFEITILSDKKIIFYQIMD